MLHKHMSGYDKVTTVLLWSGWLLLLGALGVIAFGIHQHERTMAILNDTRQELATTSQKAAELKQTRDRLKEANANLRKKYEQKREEVDELSEQVEEITGDIDIIKKKQETDEELLKKYSRVYFLSEHYKPSGLVPIPQEYRFPKDEVEQFHAKAWPNLKELLEDAEDDGVKLRIISAFRSFEEQTRLKSQYNVTYGKDTANQFSAAQGYSEHQLGTTIDLTTPKLGSNFTEFDTTEGYEWMKENAHEYGFVLSYPKNNDYYKFEPWHWRFVGEELAEDLHEKDMQFYDMPQREIDEYIVDLFDE